MNAAQPPDTEELLERANGRPGASGHRRRFCALTQGGASRARALNTLPLRGLGRNLSAIAKRSARGHIAERAEGDLHRDP